MREQQIQEIKEELIFYKKSRRDIVSGGVKFKEESSNGSATEVHYAPLKQINDTIQELENKLSRLVQSPSFYEGGSW